MMWSTVGQKSLHTFSSVTGICKLAQLSRVPSLKTIRLDRPFIDKLTYSRQLSFTAEVCRRRNPIQYDDTLFEREYDKSKHQMDLDLDDPTEALRKVAGDNERKERAIKKARAARLFPQPQEERTLTRDTIEQIRFLKQENQEEWTIPKLAESFDVSKEVIIKILKSKFTPSETRRKKQDLKAYMNAGLLPPGTDIQQAIADGDAPPNPDYLLEDGHRSKPMLADGKPQSSENILSVPRINYKMSKVNTLMVSHVKITKHSKSDSEERYRSAAAGYTNTVQMTPGVAETDGGQSQEGRGAASTHRISKKAMKNHRKGFHGKNDQQLARGKGIQKFEDANKFGNFVESDEDYAHEEGGGSDEHVKLIQKGREFYDENGEFLYRI